MEPDPDTSPPLPRVSPREAREATLDPAVRDAAARAARAARLDVLENLRNDPSRVDAFRAAVACAVADGARRVVVLDAGCTGGALAVEAARAGAEQVVAFEPDPTLATLVRDTARRVLPPADLRRLAVLEADASRVEACAGAGAAWRVRARDVADGVAAGARVSRPTVQPATQHTLSSFVATEKADCLVLGAFAVADAVEMADRFQTLARLRDEGVFDALLNIDTHTTRADESQHSHGSFVVIRERRVSSRSWSRVRTWATRFS
jgi:threonine dehydrogenase-like Zn-dependent dehydrogenase